MGRKVFFIIAAVLVIAAVFYFEKRSAHHLPPHFAENEQARRLPPLKSPSPSPSPSPSSSITENDRRLVVELEQILATKNDNDPRLDTDFRHLTDGTKELLQRKYQSFPMESRNERGTIVFLIGRDLNRPQDCQFLASVTSEKPCLSLSNCQKAPEHSDDDVHDEVALSVTLAYPQHVAIKSMENFLSRKDVDPSLREACLRSLDQMIDSPVAPIAYQAQDFKAKIGR